MIKNTMKGKYTYMKIFVFSLSALAVLLVLIIIMGFLYLNCKPIRRIGFMKKIYHDFMGWHLPGKDALTSFDGASFHSTCEICHQDIMRDSQGNWF